MDRKLSFCKRGHDMSIHRVGEGHKAQCGLCLKMKAKEWRDSHKEYATIKNKEYNTTHRERLNKKQYKNRLRKYGITHEQYQQMLIDQNGRCKICFRHNINGRNLSVDHDHVTGKVRGLLCSNCNTAMGLLGDNKERMFKMIEYLEKSEAQAGQ